MVAVAVEMGRVIAQKSPVATVGTKHLMNRESLAEVGEKKDDGVSRCSRSHVSLLALSKFDSIWRQYR